MTGLSFFRGGARVLATLPGVEGGDPTEIRVTEDGYLITRCGGELVAGPVSPASIVQRARDIAVGAPCTLTAANQMVLLILALDAQSKEV